MTVWPRLLEVMLGCWLIISPWVIGRIVGGNSPVMGEVVLGGGIVLLSGLSIHRRWEWVHSLTAPLALWLVLVPYFSYDRPGPAQAQNDILVGILLLMTVVLPTRALEPPQNYFNSSETEQR